MSNSKDYKYSCFVYECNNENKSKTESDAQELKEIMIDSLKKQGHGIVQIESDIKKSNTPGMLLIIVGILYEVPVSFPGKTINQFIGELGAGNMPEGEKPSYVFSGYIPNPFHAFMNSHIELTSEGYVGQDEIYKAYVHYHKSDYGQHSGYIPTDIYGKNAYLLVEFKNRLEDLVMNNMLSREEFERLLKDEVSIYECSRKIGWSTKKAWQGIALKKEK